MEQQFTIKNLENLPQATQWLDKQIQTSERTIIALYAPMGAGKTTLIGEYCKGIKNVSETTSSPTFAIVNKYTANSDQNNTLYHFDCYRFETEQEALEIGIFEYLDSGNLCFIEWPERIENILSQCDTLKLKISLNDQNHRILEIL